MDILDQVKKKATEMVRGLDHGMYEKRLREMDLFIHEKKRVKGRSSCCLQLCNGRV